MATTPFGVDEFGGLNLIDDPEQIGATQAVALSNVDFQQPGRLRTRDGWSLVATNAATNVLTGGTYYKSAAASEYAVVTDGTTVYGYNIATGATTATSSLTINGRNNSFVRYGTPAQVYTFIAANGTNLQIFDGATFTNVAGVNPTSGINTYLAVTAADNRLVCAGNTVGGATSETVFFSDAGTPSVFGANNYVQLWPGDGEPITALSRWRDRLFAFKQTKFAVFTGTREDSAGNPLFDYYGIDAGQGANAGAVVAGDDGLYFANNSGVYVTTGQEPVYLSRALEPWIRAGSFTGLPSLSMSAVTLAYSARILYVNDATNRTTLMYDTVRRSWSVWGLGATAVLAVPASSSLPGLYFGENGTKKLSKVAAANTTDNGSAIAWSCKSGLYSPINDPSRVAITLESKLVGTGIASLKVATYDAASSSSGALDTGSALTLGTAPVAAEAWQQIDREGAWFQHELSGSGQASVSRLVHYVSLAKPAGVA